jgi:hypothetical protein
MTGSSKQTTTQASSSEPWAAAQPALKTGLGDAQNLYKSGVGSQAYTGSTVIPFAQQTARGMYGIEQSARHNEGTGPLGRQYQNIIDNGGFNAQQGSAITGMNYFTTGARDVSSDRTNQIGQMATGPSYSEQNLMGIARGDMLNREDPNFERILGRTRDNTQNAVSMGASAAGRYGSGIHQGNVAREVGDVEANARLGQYNQERANQMSANQMVDGQRMQGLGLGLNAAGQAAGIQSDNYARRMAALQQEFNAGQQGFNNLSTAYDAMNAPARDMMGIGSMYEDLAGRLKNDELRIFQEQQNSPWNQLGRLNSVATGAGSMGGTSNSTAQVPGQSPFATGLGFASTGMGLLGSARNLGWF